MNSDKQKEMLKKLLIRNCRENERDGCMMNGCSACEAEYLLQHGVIVPPVQVGQKEKKTMSEWISVKDRLPEHTGEVLVVVGINRNAHGMFDEVRVAWYNAFIKKWTVYESRNDLILIGDITFWMPLPEMPMEV